MSTEYHIDRFNIIVDQYDPDFFKDVKAVRLVAQSKDCTMLTDDLIDTILSLRSINTHVTIVVPDEFAISPKIMVSLSMNCDSDIEISKNNPQYNEYVTEWLGQAQNAKMLYPVKNDLEKLFHKSIFNDLVDLSEEESFLINAMGGISEFQSLTNSIAYAFSESTKNTINDIID